MFSIWALIYSYVFIYVAYVQYSLWFNVSTLTTPASGFRLRPLLNVDARVEEQLSSYRAVRPSLMAELMEIVHMLDAYPSQLQSS